MTIMYRIVSYSTKIEAVEVVRTTAQSVFYHPSWNGKKGPERRARREGSFFDTWQAARDALADEARKDISRHEYGIDYAKTRLAKIMAKVEA